MRAATPVRETYTAKIQLPIFENNAFIKILRVSQNGDSTFPEFLKSTWETGIVNYEADLIQRKVSYFGAEGESYVEDYPAVEIKKGF